MVTVSDVVLEGRILRAFGTLADSSAPQTEGPNL